MSKSFVPLSGVELGKKVEFKPDPILSSNVMPPFVPAMIPVLDINDFDVIHTGRYPYYRYKK